MKGYHVVFTKESVSGWRWFIFYNKTKMAQSSQNYSSEGSVRRAFWRVMSDRVIQEIEENYAMGVKK